MDVEDAVVWGVVALVVAGLVALIVWVALSGADCPKGQELVQTGQTLIIGPKGSVIIVPQFACESTH